MSLDCSPASDADIASIEAGLEQGSLSNAYRSGDYISAEWSADPGSLYIWEDLGGEQWAVVSHPWTPDDPMQTWEFHGPGVDPKMLGESGYFWMADGWPAARCVEENGADANWTCTPAPMARIEALEGPDSDVNDRILEPWQASGYMAAYSGSVFHERLKTWDSGNDAQWLGDRSEGRWQSAMCVTHETPYGEEPDGGRRWQRGTPQ